MMRKPASINKFGLFDIFNYALMILLGILFIYPFWQVVVVSLSNATGANTLGPKLVPVGFNLDSYKEVFSNNLVYVSYFNTLRRTLIGTGLTIVVTYLGAYVLSKKNLPFRNFFTLMILFTMFFSGGLIPHYLLVQSLGLIDSYWSLVLPTLTSAWYIIIMRNFISQIPDTLEEAAAMDGAKPIRIAFQIVLPICKPIIAVVALWSAVYHWNAWFDAMIYVPSRMNVVLQLMLRKILIDQSPDYLSSSMLMQTTVTTAPETVKAATIIVSILPILAAYPFLQKYFIKGIMIGSLKG